MRRVVSVPLASSLFAGFRFPPDVIVVAVRWYLRYGLSYRDVEELLTSAQCNSAHCIVKKPIREAAGGQAC